MKREKFGSRLGFILVSAGCAIGLGNVYRFPITTGAYGGAFFVLIYIAFLILLGIPAMVAELAVGRKSRRSIATSFDVIEKPGQKWHWMKYLGFVGNYILMMFYTVIAGWMVIYFIKYASGSILSVSGNGLNDLFSSTVSCLPKTFSATLFVIICCFGICAIGLQNGVEKITKVMMLALLTLMVCLAVYSCTLKNAAEGLKFYLIPSLARLRQSGVMTVVTSAMGQAFFTLSIGIGTVAIFGSYIDKERKLFSESVIIVCLDTFVALMAGIIIFPAAYTFNNGVTAEAGNVGASFLFTTLSSIFNAMSCGRIVGSAFFLFMIFASFSTVIAVFENIISFWLELTSLKRPAIAIINIFLFAVLTIPTVLSFNIWSDITILGKGIMDFEDFVISNNLLPFGSLAYVIFCSYKSFGWGFDNFLAETNTGKKGLAFPRWIRVYMQFILPIIILFVWIKSNL